ncbi:MAG: type II toxin-antitoxin system VapC family toxin [Fimbriiglobus sp.]
MSTLYLLDTNLLVHHARNSQVWARVRVEFDLLSATPRPMLSIVSHGEIRSLALQFGWGRQKIDQLEFALGYFPAIPIHDPVIIESYAVIDAYLHSIGISLGKNDLWIAATAAVTGASLLTTDTDFDELDPLFIHRYWIDPTSDKLSGR